MVLDANNKTFIIHVAIWKQEKMVINLDKKAQIEIETQVKVLLFNKVFTSILVKYSDYNNIFSIKNVVEISKHIKLNNHIIKLKKDK